MTQNYLGTLKNNGMTECNSSSGDKLRDTDPPKFMKLQVDINFSLLRTGCMLVWVPAFNGDGESFGKK